MSGCAKAQEPGLAGEAAALLESPASPDARHSFVGRIDPREQPSRNRFQKVLDRGRLVVLASLLIGAGAYFLTLVDQHYAIREWLFWIYGKCWCAALFFCFACVSAGNACLVWVLRRTLPLVEHFVASFAVGAFVFFLAEFLIGLAGGLRPPLFFLLPLGLIGIGLRPGLRVVRRARRHLRAARKKRARDWSLPELLLTAAGVVALLLMYAPILTPDNVAYDARWYHIPLAEHYVAQGAIRRLPEGWFFGAYPHLASLYYAWAMLLPQSRYFDKVELMAHLELVFFLVTLAGVPALVRVLMPRVRAHHSWLSMFLFPEIFNYDSALHTGADHVAALWSIPVLTFLVRGLRARSARLLGFFALMAAAALNTKFTAVIIVVLPVLGALGVCSFRLCAGPSSKDRATAFRCLAACAVVGLVATAPFWLKNWIWYGDPVYPKLVEVFPANPATPDYRVPFENWFYSPEFRPPHSWEGVKAGLLAMVTFSFVPNDFSTFHKSSPLFGSLFTLLLVCVPFLGLKKRVWFTIAAVHAGVFVWYEIHHFDRYLQAILPWMAATVTVCIVAIWRMHWALRAPLAALVAVQVVWGSDAPFLGNHAMCASALKKTIELIEAGPRGRGEKRFRNFESSYAVSRVLPADAKVLVHEQHIHWGLQRASVSDWQGSQGGISYVRTGSLAGVYDLLKGMGVTHLAWKTGTSGGFDTLGSDLLFFRFAKFIAVSSRVVSDQTVARLPRSRPVDDTAESRVAMFDCDGHYSTGIYRLTRLVKSDYDPDHKYPPPDVSLPDDLDEAEASDALRERYAAINPKCHTREVGLATQAGLVEIAKRDDIVLYARDPNPEP